MKAIRQAQTRDILDAYNREDISYSRMNEMFNELADEFAIGFAYWCDTLQEKLPYLGVYEYNLQFGSKSIKELLEIYKKERGL